MGKRYSVRSYQTIAAFIGLVAIGLKTFTALGDDKLIEDILMITFAISMLVYSIPTTNAKRKNRNRKAMLVILLVSLFSFNTNAQHINYSNQISAIKESFASKSIDGLKEYISPELKFGPLPPQNTLAILTNVVSQFPKLNSMEILEHKKGEAKVKYDFEGFGVSESPILFDDAGKITHIEFLDSIINQEIKAQKALQNSIQKPNPGDLANKYTFKKVEFKSKDGLLVTGNLYEIDSSKPVILLCHQAGYNKYEYADIAPKLNELGFNCMAIDQRSGGPFASHENETFNRATQKGMKNISFLDAEQDISAAVEFLSKKYGNKVTLWGSSYSSSLALYVAIEHENINASISFSPGNYFGEEKKKLEEVLPGLKKPFFITSSQEEARGITKILQEVQLADTQIQFIPESTGFHGSRAIWEGQKGAEEYWNAVKSFLSLIYPNN